jgi:GNAT superfamily N-acetyltransferase
MGRLTVATFLVAHRDQIPEEVWRKRRDEWSAGNWACTLRSIADGTSLRECVYLAVDELCDEVIGIAMGQPADEKPWPNTGAITVLYVLHAYQGRGSRPSIGRRCRRPPAEARHARVVRVGEIEESGHALPEIV